MFKFPQSVFIYVIAERTRDAKAGEPGAFTVCAVCAFRFEAEALARELSTRRVGYDIMLACISREGDAASSAVGYDVFEGGRLVTSFHVRKGLASVTLDHSLRFDDARRLQAADAFLAALPYEFKPIGPDQCRNAAQTKAPTWEGQALRAWCDRTGGIMIRHDNGSETYLQPGDDASDLAATLDQCADARDLQTLEALLCDYLAGITP